MDRLKTLPSHNFRMRAAVISRNTERKSVGTHPEIICSKYIYLHYVSVQITILPQ